ncbi:MAG: sigma-54-dependent Fis family transcriptional regulator [Oscillospiraceae bacterium]|nr:sigma-54-dependent Fis family transcriptional regulator [Oscillospiraceae bacterium]
MDLAEMTEIWAQFVFEDKLSPKVRTPIAESWKKCKAAGVNPGGGKGRHIDEQVLASVRKENRLFLDTAVPIMHEMFDLIKGTQFLIVLTDSAGYLMEILGPPEIIARCNDMRFVPGAEWSNLEVGTNAISVALDYDTPIQMVGPEHYCTSHHSWTCSASPIHGPYGEVIGCINLSGDYKDVNAHTLALVKEAARNIEAQIRYSYNWRMMDSLLNKSGDSMIVMDRGGEPFWLNDAAKSFLHTDLEGLRTIGIQNFFPRINWNPDSWKNGERLESGNVPVQVNGETKYCSISAIPLNEYGSYTVGVILREQKHLINIANKLSGNRATHSFRDYLTVNEDMKKTLALAATFARYDGNILITGESGTGKELLAQAIHNAGKNADGPFVAVNCASIPREMFDLELFGYEANAFPGKLDEGKPGRFELAQNGTLFLDEVSAMPLEMQIKLLRAVETHCIQRFGSTREIQLNIRIISSSNQDLTRLIERGDFRKDMYYRLSALKLEIPPLRERPEDISLIAGRFLQTLNENSLSAPKRMSEDFLKRLQEYDWPGNIRELQNSVARAYSTSSTPGLSGDDLAFSMERPEPPANPAGGKNDSGEGAILAALTICRGDVQAAADRLGLSRATLYRRLKQYNINPKQLKP